MLKYLKKNIKISQCLSKAIVGQNGYEMVDFGNEVLINQLDH